jgi:hypothetical protein
MNDHFIFGDLEINGFDLQSLLKDQRLNGVIFII